MRSQEPILDGSSSHCLQPCSQILQAIQQLNEGKSAENFSCQVEAWVTDMFCNFYLVKNHKIAKKTQQLLQLEKNNHIFGILRI